MIRHLAPIIAIGALAAAALADTVLLRNASIPLPDCKIQHIKSGRVYFTDSRGRRQYREIEEVASLGFDRLPELDDAERAMADEQWNDAIDHLLRCVVHAPDELTQLWTRVRLVKAHTYRGDFVEAAGHAAAVFLLTEDPYWRHLEPRGELNRPAFPAARETMERLHEADRLVQRRELAAVVDRLIRKIRPLYDELAQAYDGPPIEPGTTLSGIPVEWIRAGAPHQPVSTSTATSDRQVASPTPRDEPAFRPAPRPGATRPRAGAGSLPEKTAASIDALLDDGRTREALALCQAIARQPKARSLSRFLHQYGRCLLAEQRPRDAAVMFMRCALLFDESEYAAPSLIEAAIIHRDLFKNTPVARRLLERAAQTAAAQGQNEPLRRANDLLATVIEPHKP